MAGRSCGKATFTWYTPTKARSETGKTGSNWHSGRLFVLRRAPEPSGTAIGERPAGADLFVRLSPPVMWITSVSPGVTGAVAETSVPSAWVIAEGKMAGANVAIPISVSANPADFVIGTVAGPRASSGSAALI